MVSKLQHGSLPLPELYSNPFHSFWMGGYECTDKLNAFGNRVDLVKATGHLQLIEQDYKDLEQFNINTVREGLRWSQVEKSPYVYDWSAVEAMLKQGRRQGIQQVWDLCHFGFPDDLTPLHPLFACRFAALCRAFVRFYRSVDEYSTLIVTPINEVNFLSWLGGDVRGTSPYCIGQGWEVKYRLMKAYIEGVTALKQEDPSIRILTTEPLVQIVPPLNATEEEIAAAARQHECQYQALDMLSGRICPELGGSPDYLDILGFNFYFNNQWENGYKNQLPWANIPYDPRWRPLSSLLQEAYMRYQRPIVLSETSHPGEHRPNWINYIAYECAAIMQQGIPLYGICLYPLIGRPDWDHIDGAWHCSGLWDAELQEGEPPARVLYQPYADALVDAQHTIRSAQVLEAETYI